VEVASASKQANAPCIILAASDCAAAVLRCAGAVQKVWTTQLTPHSRL